MSAMLALARVEAVRMLRHPVTIAAMLLFTGPVLYGWATSGVPRTPVLQDMDRNLHIAELLVLGGAALIVANLAALRAHRHGTTAQFDPLALPGTWRTGAFLLGVLPLGLLTAALAGARIAVLATAPGAAGRPNPYELLTGPAAVVLLGVAGVLLARLIRTPVAAPLALLGVGAVMYVSLDPNGHGQLLWLLPVVPGGELAPLPVDLLGRPAGAHLAYLAGLAVVAGTATLALAGARWRRLSPGIAAGLALALAGGATQLVPPSDELATARKVATEQPAQRQTCRRIQQVTYCAFAGFTPWIGEWDTVVRGVLRAVPATEAAQPFAVRQRVLAHGVPTGSSWAVGRNEVAARGQAWHAADRAAGTPNAVTVGTRWGDGQSEVSLAGLVAYEVMTRKGAEADGQMCGARAVLVVWLAGQATSATAAGLRIVDEHGWGGIGFSDPSFGPGVGASDREVAVALALLRREPGQVAALVRRHWAELTAADTPTERVGELFGVPVAPEPPEQERFVCTA